MPEQLFFLFRSPMPGVGDDGVEEITQDDGQQAPFTGATSIESSIYYYWWLFLRESRAYRDCCQNPATYAGDVGKLYPFFGNIFTQSFEDWWRSTGRELFCEVKESPVRELTAENARELRDSPYRNTWVNIAYTAAEDRVIAEVKALIHRLTINRNTNMESDSLFPIYAKAPLAALRKTYLIYRTKQSEEDLSHYDVGVRLKLWPEKPKDEAHRAACIRDISRQLQQAKAIIQNLEQGVFPCRGKIVTVTRGIDARKRTAKDAKTATKKKIVQTHGIARLTLGLFAPNRRKEYLCRLAQDRNRVTDIQRILTAFPKFGLNLKADDEAAPYNPARHKNLKSYLQRALPNCPNILPKA